MPEKNGPTGERSVGTIPEIIRDRRLRIPESLTGWHAMRAGERQRIEQHVSPEKAKPNSRKGVAQ